MADQRLAKVVHRLGWLCVLGLFLRVRVGPVIVSQLVCCILAVPLVISLRMAAPTDAARRLLDAALVALLTVGVTSLRGSDPSDDMGTLAPLFGIFLNLGLGAYGLAMAGWSDHLGLADAARRYARAARILLAGGAVYLLGILLFLALVEPGTTGDGWSFSSPHVAFGRPIEGPAPWMFLGTWALVTIVGDLGMSGASRTLRRALTQGADGAPPAVLQRRASSTRL
jgi:hypothetical protein